MAAGGSKRRDADGLTDRERLFVQRLVAGETSASAAAQAAGFSPTNPAAAKVQAHRLLQAPRIIAALGKARARAAERAEITAADVLRGFREIAECDVTSVLSWDAATATVKIEDFSKVPPEVRRCISEIRQVDTKEGGRSVLVKFHSKVDALTKLGQHLGLFREKVEFEAGETLKTGLQKVHEALQKKREREQG